jgi:hypothetical protein
MKRFLGSAAAAIIAASLPALSHAQDIAPSPVDNPPAGIHEQLDRLVTRIDRGLSAGHLSQADADRAHREVNRIEDLASVDRERDGGRLTDADRFDLQARIDHLAADVRLDRADSVAVMPDWTLERREQWIGERIQRATDDGRLSGNEEQRGRTELDAIRSEQSRLLTRDGGALSEADSGYLEQRIDELNRTLRWQGENRPPPWALR